MQNSQGFAAQCVLLRRKEFLLERWGGITPTEAITDLYLQKLPALALPARVPDSSAEPWYACQPVGKHKLNAMVATMCAEAGISERKTNHSLRVSGATSLYSGGVPEREIQQRTGHKSLEALRRYERTTEQQNQAVSNMLASSVDLPYDYHLVHASDHTVTTQRAVSSCTLTTQHPSGVDLHTL